MKKWLFCGLMLILCFGFVLKGFSQDETNFEVFSAEILEVRLEDSPNTTRVITRPKHEWEKPIEEDLTVDPLCSFYKDDRKLDTLGEIQPEDMVEITYIIDDMGEKVAFNIVVLPEEETEE